MEAPPSQTNQSPRPTYSLSMGAIITGVLSYRYASTIVQGWGWKPSQHIWVVIAISFGFAAGLILLDALLWLLRLERPARSGLMIGASIGPTAALIVWQMTTNLVWANAAGLVATILAFILIYLLDRRV